MTTYAMTHNLHKCVGCGACLIACKNENNTPEGIKWLDYIDRISGKFPDVDFEVLIVQCNHCHNAPCVTTCPTKSMHKKENGLTLHDSETCIGCKSCMVACPYEAISYNKSTPHSEWDDEKELVTGMTSSAGELAEHSGARPPYYNADREKTYPGIRYRGIVEKCTFCDHRLADGEQPACVEVCPAEARWCGDLDDADDEIHERLAGQKKRVLRPERGTEPHVFYLREY